MEWPIFSTSTATPAEFPTVNDQKLGKTLYELERLEDYEASLLLADRNVGPWLLNLGHRKGGLNKETKRLSAQTVLGARAWTGLPFSG